MSDYEVNNTSLLTAGDGSKPDPLLAKMGLAPLLTKWDFFALQGRMFNAHELVIGTALTADAAAVGAIVLTAPAFRFTVPTGTTLFPYNLDLNLVNTTGATEGEIAVVVSDGDSFTSGATSAMVIKNWRLDDTRETSVTSAYHNTTGTALVEAGLTRPRKIYTAGQLFATAAANDQVNLNLAVRWKDLIPVIGPASVIVFMGFAGAACTFEYNMSWAEVPTIHV